MSTEAILLNAVIGVAGFAGFCWWMNAIFNRSYVRRKPALIQKKGNHQPWEHKGGGRGNR
jgi:hypothetical protein